MEAQTASEVANSVNFLFNYAGAFLLMKFVMTPGAA